jgi:glycosyltransferase involved in cell wall biosynthesis
MAQAHILIFMASFGDGGVERMMVNLASGLAQAGAKASLVLMQHEQRPYLERLPPEVERVIFPRSGDKSLAQHLLAHLRATPCDIVLSTKEEDSRIALAVKSQLGAQAPRFFVRVSTSVMTREQSRKPFWIKRWLQRHALKSLCQRSDGVIANSQGVAAELAAYTGLAPERIYLAPNPTVTPDLEILSRAAVDHPWFQLGQPPVILGLGRLCRAKDFATLIRAFAQLRQTRPCRLAILGEGGQRPALEALARQLGVADDIALLGFAANPFAYLAKASLFVLSSQREGCPNALIEALALGIPAVSTDCPSGPAEILAQGAYGKLAPVGDAQALAAAMAATLEQPLEGARLRLAASPYTLENSARAYLRAFGLEQS